MPLHIPVLAEPVLHWLSPDPEGIYVDCTAGAGGHSALIAARLTTGRLLALDRDPVAVDMAARRLAPYPCAQVVQHRYSALQEILEDRGIAMVDGILIDAGCSSMQLDAPGRGFSFQSEGPLDMRMDPTRGLPAHAFLATLSQHELADLLRRFGDVSNAGRIAAAIAARAKAGALQTTTDLRQAVSEALPFVNGMPDEVRTVFQAIRIAVNEELEELHLALTRALALLKPGGRLVTIAFHSGEDRVQKEVYKAASRRRLDRHPDGRTKTVWPPIIRILTPSPVLPTPEEIAANPRAKSAKLRAVEKLPAQE
ncbi:MAG: 16S rRNA (cytosine(1402)-N(4))-methyltransferase RsmH [Candidatus Hydrogenedentes bacterium]|nr:16S rRNA (cytosine(1402)-N(4))-methyltransferase RsmH [Candidatus Hydrogenedentota bacterium]